MNKNISSLKLLLFLFIALIYFTPSFAAGGEPLKLNAVTGELKNGMKYYILPNKKPENRVELRLVVNAGSILEDEDQKGLAHFLEHMAFNGTKNFKKNELVNYLESLGVKFGPDLNAYTSFDETVYMLQIPTDDQKVLEKGFTILADWASNITFSEEEINKERGVVLSEWRTGLGAEQRMRNQYFPQLLYGSHYVDRLPIGDTSVIKKAPYEAFKRFYNDWYRPDLMAVIVVGDIDVEKIEKIINKKFSCAKNPKIKRERPMYNLPDHEDIKTSVVSDPEATRSVIRLIYKHPIAQDKTTVSSYFNLLKEELYNEMLNNRLEELTLSPQTPFLYGYSGYGGQVRTADAYYSYAIAADDKIEEALKAIVTENERVKMHGFTNSELNRAKIEVLKSYENNYLEKDKIPSASHARGLVDYFLNNDPFLDPEFELTLVKTLLPKITIEETTTLAKKWITNKNCALIITKPENEIQLDEERLKEIILNVKNQKIEPYVDDYIEKPLLDYTPKKGIVKARSYNDSLEIYTFVLDNDITVKYKLTNFQNDEILLSSYVWGGSSLVEDKDYKSAVFSDGIVMESGVGNFNKSQLQKQLAGKTVSVTPYIDDLESGFYGSCKPNDLETMFQLINLYYKKPRKDTSAFKSFINKQKNTYQNILSNPQYYFSDKVEKILYDNHPRAGFPVAKDFDNIDLDNALEIFKRYFTYANGTTFYFVGNIDPNKLEDFATTYLSEIPSSPDMKPRYKDQNMDIIDGKFVEHFKMGIAPKSNVYIKLHQDLPYSGEENLKFKAATMILSIMMRESMREDKGGVYGVRVNGSAEKDPKSSYQLTVSFNADPPMTEELVKTAYENITALKKNGPSEVNLHKIKETLLRQMESDQKENSFWLDQMMNYDKKEASINNLLKFNKKVNALSAEEIKQAANKYFAEENLIELIMSPNISKE